MKTIPCHELTQIETASLSHLWSWYRHTIACSPAGTSPTVFKRTVWSEICRRYKVNRQTIIRTWRSKPAKCYICRNRDLQTFNY